MTDQFAITPLDQLLQIILNQLNKGSVFGIPSELFFKPNSSDSFRLKRFGKLLETPVGVAAGPHTQLAQNIVVAWLTGARFIELKTIQTLDELHISKPCIDMQDEGYNCEWSQELKIHDSFEQYLDAWITIHVLQHKLKFSDCKEPGVILNMSIGYNFEGIQNENVQWFLNKMTDASEAIKQKKNLLQSIYPEIHHVEINPCISDNITLSTMHGCPVDEIQKIGEYLLEEKKLHTSVKLNPTLLGATELYKILDNSGFETKVPASAFEHDPNFKEMVSIIKSLEKTAARNKVHFGLKLTNTLESRNHKEVFPAAEEMMYLSGRPLHPISIKVAEKLQSDFDGKLDISFCAGVDFANLSEVVNSGLYPVTVCTDLLKPGGYGRINQYIEKLRSEFPSGLPEKGGGKALSYLKNYAGEVVENDRYKKTAIHQPNIKTERKLGIFDCIHAPCVDTCPTNQGIPDYLYYTSNGQFEKAKEVILTTNPFPRMTGMVCDHPCQMKCTLINYNEPVQIREVKRFIAENTNGKGIINNLPKQCKVAIIGAGPSGLSCAYYLKNAGIGVSVYEKKPKAGGMVSGAIPSFRLTEEAFNSDLKRIKDSGVKVHYVSEIDKPFFSKIQEENDFVYIATGAQRSAKLDIENIDVKGVLEPLQFLFDVKENKPVGIGKNVVIIGGGNTAMDAARTAFRLVGKNGKVTILYRRTKQQMPADIGEIKAVLEERMEIIELAAPLKINTHDDHIQSVTCIKMKLQEKDSSGRRRPVPIPESEFSVECDTIIPAIGQELDIDFADPEKLRSRPGNYETEIEGVYIGGDALRGASTAINAIGDGRKVAEAILAKTNQKIKQPTYNGREELSLKDHFIKRACRTSQTKAFESPLSDRKNFHLVSQTFSEEQAVKEASRCLLCDEFCSICNTVCPNLAFHTYEIQPEKIQLQKIIVENGTPHTKNSSYFEIEQKYQILHIADWCNQCGNCTTFCPTTEAPYEVKPHLNLSKKAFDKERDGYYLNPSTNHNILYHKEGKHTTLLARLEDHLLFKTENVLVKLSLDSFQPLEISILKNEVQEIDLKEAVVMNIIMQGAKSFIQN